MCSTKRKRSTIKITILETSKILEVKLNYNKCTMYMHMYKDKNFYAEKI